MLQSLSPDGMRLLEELQAAIRIAENEAASREARVAVLPASPANQFPARSSNPPSIAESTQSFDRIGHLADRLATKAETELTEVEVALQQWLAALESWTHQLDNLANKMVEPPPVAGHAVS